MNTYNENLQTTASNTLAALLAEQSRLKSARLAQAYSLYYAQGSEITARDASAATDKLAASSLAINDQSLLTQNTAVNLLQSATGASTDVGASVTNMATAASNVNIAANAIAALAADIGSALNNTIASLYGSEINHQTHRINALINEVANEAKDLSRQAMDASSRASEIAAVAMLSQVTAVKGQVDNLVKITQAANDKFASQSSAGRAALGKSVQVELQAQGALEDTNVQAKASDKAYHNANRQLNLDLNVKVNGPREILVSFEALPAPFPVVKYAELDHHVPDAKPSYFLALLPQDQVANFSVDQAGQLFAQRAIPARADQHGHLPAHSGAGGPFLPIEPHDQQHPVKVTPDKDINGDPVKPGTAYVAYLYIELAQDYRRFTGNFNDLLTSPSRPFVPATTLPLAEPMRAAQAGAGHGHPLRLYFAARKVDGRELDGLVFRCILVEELVGDRKHMRSRDFPEAPIYFDLDLALQVAPANYQTATRLLEAAAPEQNHGGANVDGTAAEGATDAAAQAPANGAALAHYEVLITDASTDNFGSMLLPNVRYKPYILTLVDSEVNIDSDQYISVLSDRLPAFPMPASV
jgi:hypothetical protein